ncbi:site-specific integrase [Haloarcula sp. CGMCC 1.6347]|uniref:site-specific integrase n=1 Tax=Haloarcula sp. CGMCC 1.6347 TaxID=3111455 RepID=UPI00300F50AE
MKKRQLSDGYRLYLAPAEYETLLDLVPEVGTYSIPEEVELFLRLGAESGLRGDETHTVSPKNVVESSDPDSDVTFVEVWGKDTSGKSENGKYRKSITTKATAACMDAIQRKRDLADDEPFISVGRSALDDWAEALSELAVKATGKADFDYFTVHDLRAYFATNCLVRHGMSMETVMTVGGWQDYDTMKRYLSLTSDETIIEDFRAAGLLEGTGWCEYADSIPDDDSVYSNLTAATPMGAAAQLSALGADQMATRVEHLAHRTQQDGWTLGRFSPAETEVALRAGKYGSVVGLAAAGIAGSVPAIGTSTMLPVATLALLAPLARGWHRSESANTL